MVRRGRSVIKGSCVQGSSVADRWPCRHWCWHLSWYVTAAAAQLLANHHLIRPVRADTPSPVEPLRKQRERCAILYSGHVRSFAKPSVHTSHKENLIDRLNVDHDVDVFMYLSVEDEVPMRFQMGKYADELAFTPFSPDQAAIDHAVRVLRPIAIEYHQEQAGYIPNRCEHECEMNAYWQLYKMKAVYRMMEAHEASLDQPYTWILRSRLDIAWMLPMPPLTAFPPVRVYAGHNFFPLADQVLLVPRPFARAVFETVRLCYACDILQTQREYGVPAQTENLLRLTLRREHIPFGFYEFPVVIVRSNEGGVCGVLHPHKLTCQLLHLANLIEPTVSCADIANQWYRGACARMFPRVDGEPLPSEGRIGCMGESDNGAGLSSPVYSEDKSASKSPAVDSPDVPQPDGIGCELGGALSDEKGSASVSFEVATAGLEGARDRLGDLRAAIRVRTALSDEVLTYFAAHHYPFHQPVGGDHDQIATIAGFRLSEADLNELALAFACMLFDVESGVFFKGTTGLPERSESTGIGAVVLPNPGTSTSVEAVVNCSLVQKLHHAWMHLLTTEFEPSPPVCRGDVRPCLDVLRSKYLR